MMQEIQLQQLPSSGATWKMRLPFNIVTLRNRKSRASLPVMRGDLLFPAKSGHPPLWQDSHAL
jgi:hypothetical protein